MQKSNSILIHFLQNELNAKQKRNILGGTENNNDSHGYETSDPYKGSKEAGTIGIPPPRSPIVESY